MEARKTDEQQGGNKSVKKLDENPYSPDKIKPEGVVRIFYENDIPIIPVISNRGILLGILRKEDVIAELSDIARVKNKKIDKFISNLSVKMTVDDILTYITNNKQFIVINLFGEIQGNWSRLELFEACEQGKRKSIVKEAHEQTEDKKLKWIVYHLLEHIPRALYALNKSGNTFFYNNNFEILFNEKMGREVDSDFVEQSLADPEKNEMLYRGQKEKDDVYFYNKDIKFYYEKIQLVDNDSEIGYLIYSNRELGDTPIMIPGIDSKGMGLKESLNSVERLILVESIKLHDYDYQKVAKNLKISKPSLMKKIEYFGIARLSETDTKKK